jgi:coenzyme F420-0:L-glutamate ligase/coenzyme F420-1:gamma-L-glutamate ligase
MATASTPSLHTAAATPATATTVEEFRITDCRLPDQMLARLQALPPTESRYDQNPWPQALTTTGKDTSWPATSAFCVFGLEPFPTINEGDALPDVITTVLREQDQRLRDGDIIVVTSKVVFIAEKRYIDLATITPSPQAWEISGQTGKPAAIVQLRSRNEITKTHKLASALAPDSKVTPKKRLIWLRLFILDESTEHFLATPTGQIIARHTLGYQLTSGGVDRAGATGAWLLPADPDATACATP